MAQFEPCRGLPVASRVENQKSGRPCAKLRVLSCSRVDRQDDKTHPIAAARHHRTASGSHGRQASGRRQQHIGKPSQTVDDARAYGLLVGPVGTPRSTQGSSIYVRQQMRALRHASGKQLGTASSTAPNSQDRGPSVQLRPPTSPLTYTTAALLFSRETGIHGRHDGRSNLAAP